jgi:transcription initiation factor TFIIA large subunit
VVPTANKGKLYGSVVEGVVAESRLDFEDSGLDETTLQELKQIWQERLSGFGIAKMPWDPEPVEPVSVIDSYGNGTATTGDISIKKEELYDPSSAAAMRAAAHIQKMAEDNKVAMPGIDQSVRGIMSKVEQRPTQEQPQPSHTPHGGLVLPGAKLAQTDGAVEELPLSRQEVDKIILQKIATTDRSVLEQRRVKLEINVTVDQGRKILQVDGPNEGDSEEINSDLDDSEDELNSGAEDEDEEGGMIMLCLYDKVQRVKNKWKYILKDGVANINGKDYVFSKGSGESEW